MAGVRTPFRPSSVSAPSVLTGKRKSQLGPTKRTAALRRSRPFEKQRVSLVVRAFAPRAVPFALPTNGVLTVELAVERSSIV